MLSCYCAHDTVPGTVREAEVSWTCPVADISGPMRQQGLFKLSALTEHGGSKATNQWALVGMVHTESQREGSTEVWTTRDPSLCTKPSLRAFLRAEQGSLDKEQRYGHKTTAIQFLHSHCFSGFTEYNYKNKLPDNLTYKMNDTSFKAC